MEMTSYDRPCASVFTASIICRGVRLGPESVRFHRLSKAAYRSADARDKVTQTGGRQTVLLDIGGHDMGGQLEKVDIFASVVAIVGQTIFSVRGLADS